MRSHLLVAFSIVLGACSRVPGGGSALTAQPPPAAASSAGSGNATDSAPASQPAATAQASASAGAQATETAAPQVKLAAFQVHGAVSGNTFRLADLASLILDSAYTAPPGAHTQRVEVTDPHGLLFGSLQAQITAGPDGAVSNQQSLQVAGTTIERYRMIGTWQFVLSVDGTPLASTSADIVE